ncbi:transporter [Mangrovimonas yunxiaonensis]|uniref:Transporter n=1 Tax=Mangrovimonas yunxiaonensis TaxID=1197477 RepID=A0A084TJG1_9FLAO|nr:TolC family protein [Mangrovimonas yunxiaonensis]KFB00847.1 transporter [Mangrovimonas yunxiaonensis]GGH44074.1 transporter [Mangrovimonas yunxiaonensis]
MKRKIYTIAIALFGLVSGLQAQQIVPVSKADVLGKVQESNRTLKISEADFNQAKADFRQTNAVFLPNISVSHTGMSTTNPLAAFGAKINQEIVSQSDFNPALLNDPDQIQNFTTKFEIQQPLLNFDGVYQRKAAKLKMEAMALQQLRTKDYLSLEVEKAYMQLQLAYKTVAVVETALKAAKANKQLADNSFKQGYLQKADVLAVEVRVSEVESQLHTAESHVKNASDYLSFLMHEDQEVVYRPLDSLQVEVVTLNPKDVISEERSDIKAMALSADAYKTMLKAEKMNFLPRLNAFGSYELYDDQMFQGHANGYVFGAQLSWNILNGGKRFGKIQKGQSTYDKSKFQYEQYKSKSDMELNKAWRALNDTEKKLNLTALALKQSKESLRIRTNRFGEGLEKTSDLLMAETQYAQKQLEYYQTIYQYNYAQAYVQFLTQ